MEQTQEIRKQVSAAYAFAVTQGASCCCGPAAPGVLAQTAGYTPEELASLPLESVTGSFGCGNPLAFADVRPGETVLDLGSGAGIDLILASKRVGPQGRVIGVDMTDEMLDRARTAVARSGATNIELRKGYIEELPVESGSVDLVVSNCVINLSPDKPRVFAEIARVLRPGGRMLVADLLAEDLPQEVREHPGLYASCISGAISEAEYLGGLRRAGLVDVEARERLCYDRAQIEALIRSEVTQGGCCGTPLAVSDDTWQSWTEQCAGKVTSAKVFARKPASQ